MVCCSYSLLLSSANVRTISAVTRGLNSWIYVFVRELGVELSALQQREALRDRPEHPRETWLVADIHDGNKTLYQLFQFLRDVVFSSCLPLRCKMAIWHRLTTWCDVSICVKGCTYGACPVIWTACYPTPSQSRKRWNELCTCKCHWIHFAQDFKRFSYKHYF